MTYKPNPREVLTPEGFAMLQAIAETGSFAAAARLLNMVPSALTYRVRQLEDALDVLLFDRSSRQARLTAAGSELVSEGSRVLLDIDSIANRVKRVASGWEPTLTIAVDSIVDRVTVMELCKEFLDLQPPTRLKIRSETLSGTLESVTSGYADLAVGVVMEARANPGLQREPLGTVRFVFCVAPHHALADTPDPLTNDVIRQHRAVAVADSVVHSPALTIGLLAGQEVFTVPDMPAKVDAQIRGLGVGFLPSCLVQGYIDTGRLLVKQLDRSEQQIQVGYVWRKCPKKDQGRALQWWLNKLSFAITRSSLLGERCVMR